MSDESCPNCGYCKHCGRSGPPAPLRFVPAPVIVPYQPPPQPFGPDWAPVIPDGGPGIVWDWKPDISYKVTCASNAWAYNTGVITINNSAKISS